MAEQTVYANFVGIHVGSEGRVPYLNLNNLNLNNLNMYQRPCGARCSATHALPKSQPVAVPQWPWSWSKIWEYVHEYSCGSEFLGSQKLSAQRGTFKNHPATFNVLVV